jgi:hypothetical protein
MLEAVVAVLAGLLVGVGIAVMIGPGPIRRFWVRIRRRPPRVRTRRRQTQPPANGDSMLHPTTQKVIILAARLATLLRAQGREAYGSELRKAVQRLRSDESAGLYALLASIRSLRELSLEKPDADRELQRLVDQLRQTVRDRAEQLELLPFG